MLRRACVVTVLLVLVGASCSGEKKSSDPDKPAGKVIELSGEVTAAREGGASRPLALGNEVFADDTVTTGADGSAVILLAHNKMRWSLGQGVKLRVDRSMAWKTVVPDVSAFDDEGQMATASAGRHTDREAGDTAATAQLPPEGKAEAGAPAAESAPAAPPAEKRRMENRSSAATRGDALANKALEQAPDSFDTPSGGGAIGAAAAAAPSPESAPAASRVQLGKLSVTGARSLGDVAARFAGFASRCSASAALTLTLRFDIDARGQVKNLRLTGSSAVPKEVGACVTAAARALKFAAVDGSGTTSVEGELRIEMR